MRLKPTTQLSFLDDGGTQVLPEERVIGEGRHFKSTNRLPMVCFFFFCCACFLLSCSVTDNPLRDPVNGDRSLSCFRRSHRNSERDKGCKYARHLR
mmetsp:Transcript_36539/g.87161  ORF Transcript_36539/g.87161 Transcript_36539/m.87161 type:complete len:96 (-) Transcript_36539:1802-2089(-)